MCVARAALCAVAVVSAAVSRELCVYLRAITGGAIDAKLTSSALMANASVWAVGGPTHTQQPVFTWSDPEWASVPHEGQPINFDFDYVMFGP